MKRESHIIKKDKEVVECFSSYILKFMTIRSYFDEFNDKHKCDGKVKDVQILIWKIYHIFLFIHLIKMPIWMNSTFDAK